MTFFCSSMIRSFSSSSTLCFKLVSSNIVSFASIPALSPASLENVDLGSNSIDDFEFSFTFNNWLSFSLRFHKVRKFSRQTSSQNRTFLLNNFPEQRRGRGSQRRRRRRHGSDVGGHHGEPRRHLGRRTLLPPQVRDGPGGQFNRKHFSLSLSLKRHSWVMASDSWL